MTDFTQTMHLHKNVNQSTTYVITFGNENTHVKHRYRMCIFCTHSYKVHLESVDTEIQSKAQFNVISGCFVFHVVNVWGPNHSKYDMHCALTCMQDREIIERREYLL